MSCDNDARAPNLGAKANVGEKKHIHLFAGLKEETLLQISSPHRDLIPDQSHSKVISGWIEHWVSLDCSLLIQSLAHGCHSIISKAEMRNWRARGVILQLCFLTCLLLPVSVATQMMRITSKPLLCSESKCLWVQKPWWLKEKSGIKLVRSKCPFKFYMHNSFKSYVTDEWQCIEILGQRIRLSKDCSVSTKKDAYPQHRMTKR